MEENIKKETEIDVDKNKNNKKSKVPAILLICVSIALIVGGVVMSKNFTKKDKENSTEVKPLEVYSKYRLSGNNLQPFDLYFLQLENEQKNKLYSPLSIKYALEMLSEGASC